VPIIFLTGKDDLSSLETALDTGGDDYIGKPFDLRELQARVKTILKRKTLRYDPRLIVDGLILDSERHIISRLDGSLPEVRLRTKECALLECLMKNPNKFFNSQELLEHCWPTDTNLGGSTVRTWIGFLRQKLAQLGRPDFIKTVSGVGYMVETRE
jgi:DNA-binding response OmpR family regulator